MRGLIVTVLELAGGDTVRPRLIGGGRGPLLSRQNRLGNRPRTITHALVSHSANALFLGGELAV